MLSPTSAPRGWHPPHTCPQPAAPLGPSAYAHTQLHACRHMSTHTAACTRTRVHTRTHNSCTHACTHMHLYSHTCTRLRRTTVSPGTLHQDPPAASPWGSGPQGHSSRGAWHGRAAALLHLSLMDGCVRTEPRHHRRTGGHGDQSWGVPSLPLPLRPLQSPYPPLPSICPRCSTKKEAVPVRPGQPAAPTSPAPPGHDLLPVPVPVPIPLPEYSQ